MNGDSQKIYDEIKELQKGQNLISQTQVAITTKVDLRHEENVRFQEDRKKEVDMMFKLVRELPCGIHIERMTWLNRWVTAIGTGLVALAVWTTKLHLK